MRSTLTAISRLLDSAACLKPPPNAAADSRHASYLGLLASGANLGQVAALNKVATKMRRAGSGIDYAQQGDAAFDNTDNRARRAQLRHNPLVLRGLKRFWKAALNSLATDDLEAETAAATTAASGAPERVLHRAGYAAMLKRIYRTLLECWCDAAPTTASPHGPSHRRGRRFVPCEGAGTRPTPSASSRRIGSTTPMAAMRSTRAASSTPSSSCATRGASPSRRPSVRPRRARSEPSGPLAAPSSCAHPSLARHRRGVLAAALQLHC